MNCKRISMIICLLFAIGILGICPSVVSAEEVCDHEYNSEIFEPTCTEEGFTSHGCSLCFDVYYDSFVPATGHTPNIPEPTETEFQYCTECDVLLDYLYITGSVTHRGLLYNDVTYRLDRNGVLTFSGTNSIGDNFDADNVQFPHIEEWRFDVTEIVINEGITGILDKAFPEFPNLTSVSLPESLDVIGQEVFKDCTKLAHVDFPSDMDEIRFQAFANCHSLTELTLPDNVNILYAFRNCTGLKKVVLPKNGLTEGDVFSGCTSLTDAELHGDLTGNVFMDCTQLKNVVIGSDVSSMDTLDGDGTFSGCTALTTIHIPGNVKSMSWTFFNCPNLKTVTIEYGVEKIGERTFSSCQALENIVIPGSVTELGEQVFWNSRPKVIYFAGNAPTFAKKALFALNIGTICYYPSRNSTWDSEALGAHGADTINWQPYDHTHNYFTAVTEPDCTTQGYTTYTCSCGNSYTGDFIPATKAHIYDDDSDTVCNVCGEDYNSPSVYRLYNPYTHEHLFTMDITERNMLVNAGWTLDGIAFKSPREGQSVYRLYNPYDDWHTYTMSQDELDTLLPLGWKIDGILCYSETSENGKVIYRLFNPYEQKNYHLLTSSEEERAFLEAAGWRLDGAAWYCLSE